MLIAQGDRPSQLQRGEFGRSNGMASERDDVLGAVLNWLDREVPLPMDLEKDMDRLSSLSSVDTQGNPIHRDRVRSTISRLRRLSSTLDAFSTALTKRIDDFVPISRLCGIALLPNESLSEVFHLVVYNSQFCASWKAAVMLSHVDRRFRAIVLEYPRLWTEMGLGMSREMVKTCFPRTKGLPLSVTLNAHLYHASDCTVDLAAEELLPLSEYWGDLTLSFSVRCDDGKPKRPTGQSLNRINAPFLKTLRIYAAEPIIEVIPLRDWSQWNCPRLHHVIALDYFPLHLPGLSNVSVLDLVLHVEDKNMAKILDQLVMMKNLQYLELEFVNLVNSYEFVVFDRHDFLQIKDLKLTTEVHIRVDNPSPGIKRSIFSSMFFPAAVRLDLTLKVDSMEYESYRDIRDTHKYYFNEEINRLLRHADQFPLVEEFSLEIVTPSDEERYSEDRSEIYVPLNMLPSLKRFTLNCNSAFDIKEPEEPDGVFYEDEHTVAPRVAGDAFPVLEAITLDVKKPYDAAGWVKEYLREVQNRGMCFGPFGLALIKHHRG
ncbi:hypothetical protein SCHPADRAFT_1003188 [Schizopora paradoxa]|uniref:F-box domain-containing protein n=1 Tax=Schizopora paradoxa TaxID=27342 RepID=A0A0H2R0N8_9AGAM|nr:hypothetical protein SCHPADRAFT_1003188 [Schizopora paradoxa]